MKLIEGEDFYYSGDGLVVLTEKYHLKRGSCCGNGCLHCPYEHKNVKHKPKSSCDAIFDRASELEEENSLRTQRVLDKWDEFLNSKEFEERVKTLREMIEKENSQEEIDMWNELLDSKEVVDIKDYRPEVLSHKGALDSWENILKLYEDPNTCEYCGHIGQWYTVNNMKCCQKCMYDLENEVIYTPEPPSNPDTIDDIPWFLK
jgi:hypothetical protein